MNLKIVINIVVFCLLSNQSVQSIMNKRNTEAGGKSKFSIDERYPEGVDGETPSILLERGKHVNFSCSSVDDFNACQWKGPFSRFRSCQIFGDMKSEECSGIDGWSAKSNFQVIKEEKNGVFICTISGYIGKDPLIDDEGTWSCRLEELETTSYADDLQYFNVSLLRPARVSASIDHTTVAGDRGSSAEMFETDVAEITCTAQEGFPQPKIQWFLNNILIEFESREFRDRFQILTTEGPTERRDGWFQQQRIRYTADKKDNEEILQCKVDQVDDQGSIVTTSNNDAKYRLYIKSIPSEPIVDVAMIGAISGIIIILILALLLLGFAYRSRKLCFSKDVLVIRPEDPNYEELKPMNEGNNNDLDHVSKVTKYQTHLIMLANKLAENPDSKETAKNTDSLARDLDHLIRNMEKREDNQLVKNRFLTAAQGLTESVGELLSASEKCSAAPGNVEARAVCDGAAHQVETQVKQSVTIIKTILLLRQLEATAREAVRTATEGIELTKDNNNLGELATKLSVVMKILEEKLEDFAESPGSADCQSYLLIAAKRFLSPADGFIDKAQQSVQTFGDVEVAKTIKAALDEAEKKKYDLRQKIELAESSLLTLDIEAAAQLIHKLMTDLEQLKAEADQKHLSPVSAEASSQATERLSKAGKKVRFGLDQVFHYALAGQRDGLASAAKETVNNLSDFKSAVAEFAAASGDPANHQLILGAGVEAVHGAELMMNNAQRTVLHPANPLSTQSLLQSSNYAGKSVKATLLANPDMMVMTSNKLTKGLVEELEEFRGALAALKVKPLPGQTREVVSHRLQQSDKALQRQVNSLVAAAVKADKHGTNLATREAVLALDDYKNATKEVATILTDKKTQNKVITDSQQVLLKSADLFLEAQNALKRPGDAGAARELEESVSQISSMMKDLEKTYIFGAPGQEQYVSALNIMGHATKELHNPSPQDPARRDDIPATKGRLMTNTKEIAQLAQDILTRSNTDPERLDGLTPRLAQYYKNLTSDFNFITGQVEEDSTTEEARRQALELGQSIVELIENTCVQQVLPTQDSMVNIAATAQTVAGHSVKLLSSVNTVAKRAQALDDLAASLSGVVNSLDTTIMFARAGTLDSEDDRENFSDHRDDILQLAQVLVGDVQALLSASTETKQELISAGETAHTNVTSLVEKIKSAATSLGSGNQETQVMLLNSARDVCSSMHGLLVHAKTANGEDLEHPAYEQVSDYSRGVVQNITNLLKSVKSFEDESTRGTRAVESSIEAISQEIQEFSSESSSSSSSVTASPEDLIKANRAITQATHKAVAASTSGRQEDLLAAANTGRRAISELLTTCRGAAAGCPDPDLRQRTLELCHSVASQYSSLLSAILSNQDKAVIMDISRTIAQNALVLTGLAERMKVGGEVDNLDGFGQAEIELLNAAEAIEQAARNLESLRPAKKPGQDVNYDDMTFDELIIDSAKSIATATSALVKAASEAQKELVEQGKVATQYERGSEESQWSEGLISAARLVAAATHSLCDAANKLVRGEGAEELLIAAAKQVSKSTAQLVLACKVKADASSRAMEGLKTASDAVRKATDALVRAAQRSIKKPGSPKMKVDKFKLRIEAEARVIRLEKDLQESKELQQDIREASQGSVTDIKREREAESRVITLSKELEEARKYCLRLNEEEYNR